MTEPAEVAECQRASGFETPKTVHRRVKALVEAGKVVILDRGTQGEKGLASRIPSARSVVVSPSHHQEVR